MGRHVNKRELAELFDISERTFTRYQRDGMPVAVVSGRGVANAYDTAEVHRWLCERFLEGATEGEDGGPRLDLNAERARLAKAQADKVELELEVRRGQLVETEAAQLAWGRIIQLARARILALPSKAAPLVVGVKKISAAQTTLMGFVREVLEELANPDLAEEGEE